MEKLTNEQKNSINGGIALTTAWIIMCGIAMGVSAITNIVTQALQTNAYNNAINSQKDQGQTVTTETTDDGKTVTTTTTRINNSFNYNPFLYMPPALNNSGPQFRISAVPIRSQMII